MVLRNFETKMKILFVCRHNRFRSKTAEALLMHYDKKIKVKSAGVELDLPYVAQGVKEVLKEYGIKKVKDKPTFINNKLLKWADKIIVVADNVDTRAFPKEKVEVWKISDCDQDDVEGIKLRVREIDNKVKRMLKN